MEVKLPAVEPDRNSIPNHYTKDVTGYPGHVSQGQQFRPRRVESFDQVLPLRYTTTTRYTINTRVIIFLL